MELDIHGLKCDSCEWEDMSIPYSEYESRINSKCPECGAVLLTQEEFNQCEAMHANVKRLNKMTPEEQQAIIDNASPEDIDKALDFMNDLGMKETEE